jgi:DNA-binding NtrC family response regulator
VGSRSGIAFNNQKDLKTTSDAIAERLKIGYIDLRTEFFSLLNKKLGSEFLLVPASPDGFEELTKCDAIVFPLQGSNHPAFASNTNRLRQILGISHLPPVIVFLPSPDRELMRLALANGAYDYFVESGPLHELQVILRRAAQYRELMLEHERLKISAARLDDFGSIIATDPKMRVVLDLTSKVAQTDARVLITGESGTGKELFARAIHRASSRRGEPYVAVACSSLPETLIESELFGHEKGAFTGATAARRGRFEAAERGTIFLDEVGDMAPSLQVKLLRVLQERSFERLGSNEPRSLEARVICATNRDLKTLVAAGSFRLDLYYRLKTVEIHLPPLRERRGDIVALAYTYLETYARQYNRPVRRISSVAMNALEEHDWAGNVRELASVIERAVVVCDSSEIQLADLPPELATHVRKLDAITFREEVREFKRRLITRALLGNDHNKVRAALSLKLPRSSLHRLIGELNIPELRPLDGADSDATELADGPCHSALPTSPTG